MPCTSTVARTGMVKARFSFPQEEGISARIPTRPKTATCSITAGLATRETSLFSLRTLTTLAHRGGQPPGAPASETLAAKEDEALSIRTVRLIKVHTSIVT